MTTRSHMTHWPELAITPRWRRPIQHGLAQLLRALSRGLAELAARLHGAERKTGAPTLEFHAEAGAPEGALYVNGDLIGYLPGVSRL